MILENKDKNIHVINYKNKKYLISNLNPFIIFKNLNKVLLNHNFKINNPKYIDNFFFRIFQ